jgi:hypothetical protein
MGGEGAANGTVVQLNSSLNAAGILAEVVFGQRVIVNCLEDVYGHRLVAFVHDRE